MKKIVIIASMLFTVLTLSSCQKNTEYDIVTTLFPQYDMTRSLIEGTDLTVTNLLPFGSSPHNFELTSKDRQTIYDATLFIYTSDELELWAKNLNPSETQILNLESTLDIIHDEHAHEDETHDEDEHDVHYWTNPHTLEDMLHQIKDTLEDLYPQYVDLFEQNYDMYLSQLESLAAELSDFLISYTNTPITLYIAGHNAMEAFGDYFGFDIVSLFPEFIPDAELTSLEITNFIDAIRTNNIQAFFIEPLFDTEPLAAETIKTTLANQSYTVSYYVLHQFHNISATDFENQLTLFDIFSQNIEHIKEVITLNYGQN